ncbi:MAG TPA: MBL fold metallo-hydrolase [Candidatus Acidoferrum sp.]|nr:MBL fold metallo-hydrolase [Candidatus Acidoferrum sp.]
MSDALALTSSLGEGIVQIRLPMAGNPLRYINGYLLEDGDGYTLIDCGWKADDVFAALQQGLAEHGVALGDIRRLLITHYHFDHYGLAGTLLAAGVPSLAMHALDWEIARMHGRDPVAADVAADAWIERNGLRVEESLEDELQHRRYDLVAPTELIDDGERIGRLTAVWTPGHSPGHLCFHDLVSGRLFSGDHVLDPITPHVGIWREGSGDPLGSYVRSLEKVATLGASGVFPAHGEPFPDLQRRIDELLAHEAKREEQVLAALVESPASAAGIAGLLPWRRRGDRFEQLSEAHRQFAVAETLAHLEHLRVRGLVVQDAGATPIRYALTTAAVQRV